MVLVFFLLCKARKLRHLKLFISRIMAGFAVWFELHEYFLAAFLFYQPGAVGRNGPPDRAGYERK